jgi:hypothetical protein
MNFSVILPIYIKPRLTALSQPLWMAAHTSDWGDSLNQGRRGGKLNTMMMMFVARVVLMFNRFLILFLSYDIYGAGVFVPAQTLIGVILLTGIPLVAHIYTSL